MCQTTSIFPNKVWKFLKYSFHRSMLFQWKIECGGQRMGNEVEVGGWKDFFSFLIHTICVVWEWRGCQRENGGKVRTLICWLRKRLTQHLWRPVWWAIRLIFIFLLCFQAVLHIWTEKLFRGYPVLSILPDGYYAYTYVWVYSQSNILARKPNYTDTCFFLQKNGFHFSNPTKK